MSGFQVDVEALQGTVSKLRAIADGLDQPKSHARYEITIAAGVLGERFAGADVLHDTHHTMQIWIEKMIGQLQSFINEYSDQTHQAADNYTEQEHQTKQDFFSAGGSTL